MRSLLLLIASACLMAFSKAQIAPNYTQIVNKINEIRTNPSLFSQKMQTNYSTFDFNTWIIHSRINNFTYNYTFMTTEGYVAFEEAVSVLASASKAPNLTYAKGLTVIGQFDINAYRNASHWLDTPYDVCGQNVGNRVKELGSWKEINQAIVGGINETELMLVALLVGDGDQYRRARNAILNQTYTHVGIGEGNLTNVSISSPVYNFLFAENFNCTNTCPDIPALNDSFPCVSPYPFTYGGGTLLMSYMALMLLSLLVLLAGI